MTTFPSRWRSARASYSRRPPSRGGGRQGTVAAGPGLPGLVPGKSLGEARPARLGTSRWRHEEAPGSGEVGRTGSADVRKELSELLTRPENAVPGHVPDKVQLRDLLLPRLLTRRPRTGAR